MKFIKLVCLPLNLFLITHQFGLVPDIDTISFSLYLSYTQRPHICPRTHTCKLLAVYVLTPTISLFTSLYTSFFLFPLSLTISHTHTLSVLIYTLTVTLKYNISLHVHRETHLVGGNGYKTVRNSTEEKLPGRRVKKRQKGESCPTNVLGQFCCKERK